MRLFWLVIVAASFGCCQAKGGAGSKGIKSRTLTTETKDRSTDQQTNLRHIAELQDVDEQKLGISFASRHGELRISELLSTQKDADVLLVSADELSMLVIGQLRDEAETATNEKKELATKRDIDTYDKHDMELWHEADEKVTQAGVAATEFQTYFRMADKVFATILSERTTTKRTMADFALVIAFQHARAVDSTRPAGSESEVASLLDEVGRTNDRQAFGQEPEANPDILQGAWGNIKDFVGKTGTHDCPNRVRDACSVENLDFAKLIGNSVTGASLSLHLTAIKSAASTLFDQYDNARLAALAASYSSSAYKKGAAAKNKEVAEAHWTALKALAIAEATKASIYVSLKKTSDHAAEQTTAPEGTTKTNEELHKAKHQVAVTNLAIAKAIFKDATDDYTLASLVAALRVIQHDTANEFDNNRETNKQALNTAIQTLNRIIPNTGNTTSATDVDKLLDQAKRMITNLQNKNTQLVAHVDTVPEQLKNTTLPTDVSESSTCRYVVSRHALLVVVLVLGTYP